MKGFVANIMNIFSINPLIDNRKLGVSVSVIKNPKSKIQNPKTIVKSILIMIANDKLPSSVDSFQKTWNILSKAWKILVEDYTIVMKRDPAAKNWLEIFFLYPGPQAIILYRLAHLLHNLGVFFLPRFISHLARFLTGIEIHPGARIGKGVFIDHGMGVVIGETAVVGDYCLLYQGVTLGGTGKERGKRHPTLGRNVTVGSGAKILGNINIGSNVRVGAVAVVLKDIPSNSTVVGIPGRVIAQRDKVEIN